MPVQSEPLRGLIIALASYGVFAGSDAFIKSNGGTVPIFEIGFFITLFSAIPILIGRHGEEKWREALKITYKRHIHTRALSGLCGSICAIYAFTHLELAEAYALIFLVPAFTTIVSIFALGEEVGWRRWSATILGFIGVLVVIRPGFEEVKPAHLAGLGVALFGAISITTLRSISGREKRTSILAYVFLYSLVFYTVAMLPNFKMPSLQSFPLLAGAGILSGLGHIFMLRATSLLPASKIAPTQYSQIIWAVLFGYVFFNEFPDLPTFAGLSIIAFSGLLIFMREKERQGERKRITLFRNRL